jgi:hypothetical protein
VIESGTFAHLWATDPDVTPRIRLLVAAAIAAACNPPPCEEARPVLPALARLDPVVARAPKPIEPIGVASCDEYVAQFERCIEDHALRDARVAMYETLADTATAWRGIAAGPGREFLDGMCRAAIAGARSATSAMGCDWDRPAAVSGSSRAFGAP